jgi:hypothetical protein
MTHTYSVTLTDTEKLALDKHFLSPQDLVDNIVVNQVRISTDEIISMYTTRALDEGVQIPSTRELIVADAFTRGWAKTAEQRNAEAEASDTP